MARLSYEKRLERCTSPILKKLFTIIIKKRSNLCVAANFDTFDDILDYVDRAGPHICMLKVQLGRHRLNRDGRTLEEKLKLLHERKKEFDFLLFEDQKLYDGSETVAELYRCYVNYCDLVTVVPIGDSILKAIESVVHESKLGEDEPRGCLPVCQMSFADANNVPDPEISLQITRRNSSICPGIIAQTLQVPDPFSMIKLSPGVHLSETKDHSNQQWRHPSRVVGQGADVLIVGRGIVSGPKDIWESLTVRYKEACYQAYLDDVSE